MTVPRSKNRYSHFIIAPLVALACEAGATASVAPNVTTEDTAERSGKIVGGGGLNISVYDAGSAGAPPIVFIHGFSQNFMTWDRQFRDLADRFHVNAYDFRGHGSSEKPLEPEKYTDSSLWADDLAAVIQSRNLHRPVLVGWSYGGYVIADYIRKYGDAGLGGLVFVGATTKNGTEEAAGFLTEEVLGIFGDVLAPDVRTSLDATGALARMFAPPQQWEVAFGSAMMVAPQIRLAMFSRLLDNDDVLASIRVPTLVMHGANDRIVRLSAAEHTARTIPGAKLLVYNGLGHAPHLDNPVRFNRDLAEFVRSVWR
jgi:non-heme chloroperoxidase